MTIKAVFFDIDGTLIDMDADDISPAVKDALRQLQNQGIKIFFATGRPPYFLPEEKDIRFDGALCFNGAFCYDNDHVISSNAIPSEDVKQIIQNADHMHKITGVCTAEKFGTNGYEDMLEAYMNFSGHTIHIADDFEEMIRKPVFMMMVSTVPQQDEELLHGTKHVSVARWWNNAVDLIPEGSSKAEGMRKIMRSMNLDVDACMAFGDGGNDTDMIEAAGVGVAMGNADEDVQSHADYVTDTCKNDGIVSALKHFNLIV